MKLNRLILVIGVVLAFWSCEKDDGSEPNPPISDVPQITFISVNKTTIREFQDELIFTISYLDGNGDVGFENADSASLFVTDNRFPLTFPYHLSPFAPLDTSITIQGVLNVVQENIILKDPNATQETATFTIKLKDRAGNWSNEVTSPQVTITP